MAHFYMPPMLAHETLISQYSVLHQERLYLLDALAEEESQGERLTQSLIALHAQIHAREASNPPANTKRLRQQAKTVRQRVGACQHRERALATNLASVVAQMEGMKRYQLSNMQQDDAVQFQQAHQHAQMVLMSPARPAFALRSPANLNVAAQMQYLSLAPSAGPVFGNRASLDPYMGTLNQPFTSLNMSGSFPEHTRDQYHTEPSPTPQHMATWPGFNEMDVYTGTVSLPMSAMSLSGVSPTSQDWENTKNVALSRQRASSLLETVYENQSSEIKSKSAIRRLSLLDGSAALKLQREEAEERARGLAGWV